jgi:dTDP-4-dehydrorhamnose reductase
VTKPGRLLVTGAGGMLGQAVLAAGRQESWEVHGASHGELDVTDAISIDSALERWAPDVVVNCAAWTDVDGAESQREQAWAANASGPAQLAAATSARAVRLIHISTDYVFDGAAQRPYRESDPPSARPATAYGASKLAGEQEVLARPGTAVVRTSWLHGVGGSNFVDTMLGLAAAGRHELSVVTDQRGSPTWTGHLAPALVELARGDQCGVLHLANSGECTWNDLAREVFAQAGYDVRVLASDAAEQARPAPRPAYSVLASERADAPRLPDWRDGVRGHLAGALIAAPGVAR